MIWKSRATWAEEANHLALLGPKGYRRWYLEATFRDLDGNGLLPGHLAIVRTTEDVASSPAPFEFAILGGVMWGYL